MNWKSVRWPYDSSTKTDFCVSARTPGYFTVYIVKFTGESYISFTIKSEHSGQFPAEIKTLQAAQDYFERNWSDLRCVLKTNRR